VDLAHAGAAREAIEAIAVQDAVDIGIRYPDVVVALEIPDDPHGAEMVGSAQMQHLLLNLRHCLVGRVLRNWLAN
jgi:hypothetical protein